MKDTVRDYFDDGLDHSAELRPVSFLGKNWAHLFLLTCFAIFGSPITTLARFAEDPSVQFWVGESYGSYSLIVPWLLAFCHLYHVRAGSPRVIPVICSTFVPAVLLGVIASIHTHESSQYVQRLFSQDCKTWEFKRNIQNSWTLAAGLYERCVARTTAEHGISFEEGLGLLRLQDCREYKPQEPDMWASHREDWQYLQMMEEEHECSGWCHAGLPLWTFQKTQDGCAATAANVMMRRVITAAKRVTSYSIVVGVASCVFIWAYGHYVRLSGVEWSFL